MLLDIIRKNKDLRTIFGQRELKIIEKQLLGVRLKPSERTRLSRDIRKKFEAIKSLTPFLEDFKLKHGLVIKRIIQEVKEVILKSRYSSNIKKIVLFGSATGNQFSLISDIDISVEFDKIDKRDALKFRLETLRELPEKVEVDIQVFNVLPEKIKKEINENGKILYEQKN